MLLLMGGGIDQEVGMNTHTHTTLDKIYNQQYIPVVCLAQGTLLSTLR